MDEDREFMRAKNYSYRLLSFRQRSVKEIKDRLQRKRYPAQIIQRVVVHLSKLNYLNDENFAQFWMRSRTRGRAVGCALIRYQLRQKGVPPEILEKVFSESVRQYDELAAAKELIDALRRRYRGLKPAEVKKRLYGCLMRRGFTQETIAAVIK